MTPKIAIKIMLGLMIVVILFHLSIVVKLIPYNITWGGRLKNDSEMYVFEAISITINLILSLALLIKGAYLKAIVPIKVVNAILWVFFFIFALNTIGNIVAKTNFEKFFAIITALSSYLIWVILKRGIVHSNNGRKCL